MDSIELLLTPTLGVALYVWRFVPEVLAVPEQTFTLVAVCVNFLLPLAKARISTLAGSSLSKVFPKVFDWFDLRPRKVVLLILVVLFGNPNKPGRLYLLQ